MTLGSICNSCDVLGGNIILDVFRIPRQWFLPFVWRGLFLFGSVSSSDTVSGDNGPHHLHWRHWQYDQQCIIFTLVVWPTMSNVDLSLIFLSLSLWYHIFVLLCPSNAPFKHQHTPWMLYYVQIYDWEKRMVIYSPLNSFFGLKCFLFLLSVKNAQKKIL